LTVFQYFHSFYEHGSKKAGIATNVRNVQRVIKKSKHIIRRKMKRKPKLSKRHQEARLEFAKTHVTWDSNKWRQVRFSDEKKFNLDGPDGFSYYYHDLRKDERILSRRQMGGGSVMVWAFIGYEKKGDIGFLPKKVNSQCYNQLLEQQKREFTVLEDGEPAIFQQDNAPVHTARIINEFFLANKIGTMDWPALSPDLNIIENVWGLLARFVYPDGKQYSSVEELKRAILHAWEAIPQEKIQKLYDSLPNRMLQVIQAKGKSTTY